MVLDGASFLGALSTWDMVLLEHCLEGKSTDVGFCVEHLLGVQNQNL